MESVHFGDLFTGRQLLTHVTLISLIGMCAESLGGGLPTDLRDAVKTVLAIIVDRCIDKCASLVVWHIPGEKVEHVFGRQAMPMVWDFADANILSDVGWDAPVNGSTKFWTQP